jgi:hypothetical protein
MLKLFIEYLHYARVKLKLNRKSELLRILNKQSPLSILEIGVDEGENTIRLISELSKKVPISKIRYIGIDLFGLMNPEIAKNEASQIPKSKIDIEILLTSNFPNLNFELLEGNSNEILSTINENFEFVFIDGGHSYETVKKEADSKIAALEIELVNAKKLTTLTQVDVIRLKSQQKEKEIASSENSSDLLKTISFGLV